MTLKRKQAFKLALVQATLLDFSVVQAALPSDCSNSIHKEGTIGAYYDTDTELIVIEASLDDGSYTGWGWGSTMTDTEMVIFSADGNSSSVDFYYSTGNIEPAADPDIASCYETSHSKQGKQIRFTATRPLECDVKDSYVVQLDKDLSLCYAWNEHNS